MRIAFNYYPEVLELISEKKIEADYIKFPALAYQMKVFEDSTLREFTDKMNEILSCGKVLLHGLNPVPHNIGSIDFIDDFCLETAERVLGISQTPGISLHLAGLDQELSREENIRIITRNVQYLIRNYPEMSFVSLENVDSPKRHGISVDPTFIREVINTSGADFLLDISHAIYAAYNFKEDIYDYLMKLPLDKVKEIHINGWMFNDNGFMAHIKITEEGYEILKWVLGRCKPEIITVEYGRTDDRIKAGINIVDEFNIKDEVKKDIIEQYKRIKEIISNQVYL